ncbi:hypothetical protein KK062_23335 [Fulvivirgaceae bacterium PWU5]|uniref:Uncharacterized protein n=1 Tax=Dawidia cretensis TaxID=2782350 RepID=A0AAP2E3W4_9BACT|nr:hypothetical protein [Dawidia cretensis]MBT1711197.1 hypothetical protein [Dawidia cretensis]
MKKIGLITLVLTLAIEAKTQNLIGEWYAIDDENLAELVIHEDSIKARILVPGGDSKGSERTGIKHFGIYEVHDKRILIVPDDTSVDAVRYRAMTFFNIRDGISVELAVNGITMVSKEVDKLIDLNASDTTRLFGNVFYHKDYLQLLNKKQNMETMTLPEFKEFLAAYVNKREMYSYRERYMPATFQQTLINSILIEMAFNPINKKDWFNRFLEKYLMDKEVEALWRKM